MGVFAGHLVHGGVGLEFAKRPIGKASEHAVGLTHQKEAELT